MQLEEGKKREGEGGTYVLSIGWGGGEGAGYPLAAGWGYLFCSYGIRGFAFSREGICRDIIMLFTVICLEDTISKNEFISTQ